MVTIDSYSSYRKYSGSRRSKLVLEQIKGTFSRLELIWDDAGYSGKLVDWVNSVYGRMLDIVKRSNDVKGFQVLPRRWVVERHLGGWVGIEV